ncbi:MAG: hypothetical protein ACRC68_11965 [Clostridium sp.]
MKAIEILKNCMSDIEQMSQSEFDSIVEKKNINEIEYDINKYIGGDFNIILPSKTIKQECYMSYSKAKNRLNVKVDNIMSDEALATNLAIAA